MLEALPSCFSGAAETSGATTSTTTPTKMSPNLVTCIYQIEISGSPSFLTLTWSKTLLGRSLTLHLDRSAYTLDISPSFFYKNKPGSKFISFGRSKAKIFWDFTNALYTRAAEPSSGFYLCLVYDGCIVFLLGDRREEAARHCGAAAPLVEPTLLSRREHIFGRQNYTTKARFGLSERSHEIGIECSTRGGDGDGGGGSRTAKLSVMVDGNLVLEVKHLQWKFRGNERIFVDGSSVDIFWDVYNWLFCSSGNGHAVFMFQSGGGGGGGGGEVAQWPELVAAAAVPGKLKGPEKRLLRKSFSSLTSSANSVLQWAESGGSSSGGSPSSGFSLLLYAWRSE